MLRVDEIQIPGTGAIRASQRITAAGLHAAAQMRACGVAAVLIAGSLFGMSASGQAPAPSPPSTPGPHAVTVPAAPAAKNAKRPVVSPYARAAAQQARAGQPSTGHAPTRVQSMGKPRKPHPRTPSK
jgi:hypothetical protein